MFINWTSCQSLGLSACLRGLRTTLLEDSDPHHIKTRSTGNSDRGKVMRNVSRSKRSACLKNGKNNCQLLFVVDWRVSLVVTRESSSHYTLFPSRSTHINQSREQNTYKIYTATHMRQCGIADVHCPHTGGAGVKQIYHRPNQLKASFISHFLSRWE